MISYYIKSKTETCILYNIADHRYVVIISQGLVEIWPTDRHISGVDPGFQARGAHLNKLRRAEGGVNIFGVFRVKIHDFTPKKQITESPSYP